MNTYHPTDGIIAGGQPSHQDLENFAKEGVQTVLNLRMSAEQGVIEDERAIVEGLGMTYVHMPIPGAAGVTVENADKLSDALENASGPVLLHCASSNRVGALLAIRAHRHQGLSLEAALELGRAGGLTKLEPLVIKALNA